MTSIFHAPTEKVKQIAEDFSFEQVGIAKTKPLTIELYRQWLKEGLHGEMHYLQDHLAKKEDPNQVLHGAQSIIVVTKSYHPHPSPNTNLPQSLRIAKYAQGNDYHHWFKQCLSDFSEKLKSLFPEEHFICTTDSGPLLERDYAYQAGLGWFGKNTCIIHPKKGSLFFIGEVLTTLDLSPAEKTLPDFCGTCNRCIEICPTDAITQERKLDAKRCISYLTIESRELPPKELRSGIGDWFFGCDLCQTVCPWNQKVFGSNIQQFQPDQENMTTELRFILSASGKSLEKKYLGTPLLRAGPFGLKRNAIIVATNLKLAQLLPEISALKTHQKLKDLVIWSEETMSAHT